MMYCQWNYTITISLESLPQCVHLHTLCTPPQEILSKSCPVNFNISFMISNCPDVHFQYGGDHFKIVCSTVWPLVLCKFALRGILGRGSWFLCYFDGYFQFLAFQFMMGAIWKMAILTFTRISWSTQNCVSHTKFFLCIPKAEIS